MNNLPIHLVSERGFTELSESVSEGVLSTPQKQETSLFYLIRDE